MAKSKVTIGYVHPAQISSFFVSSLIRLLRVEHDRVQGVIGILSGPKVDDARNILIKTWLTESDSPRLLMVDTDMVLPPDSIKRLVSHNKDIVGGLAFSAGWSTMRPTLHVITATEEGLPTISIMWDYPENSLVQVDATGGACLMITRKAAMAIWEARGLDHPMPWFAFGMHNGVPIGEDVAFCLTAGKLGFKTYVDTGLVVPHVKPQPMTEEQYVRSLMQEDHPYYTRRGEVPVYRTMTGYDGSSIDHNQQDPQGI